VAYCEQNALGDGAFIYEREDALVIVADMPGVSEKNVDIHLENDTLKISGRAEAVEPEGYELLYSEYMPGDYERLFTLSADVDREGIKASMRHGVLRVMLPKSEKAKPRKITVQSES
jgi:HSP20 family molecular chaperone IbpA